VKDYTTRVELMAIPIVALILGGGLILALASEAGLWAWLLVGVAAVVLAALLLLRYARRNPHPAASQPAPTPAPAAEATDGDTYRVLVIADESCVDPGFPAQIAGHADGRTVDVLVVAPAIGSRLSRWTGDESSHVDARKHLDDTVTALARAGITARGETGADDPLQAADDGLRSFDAHEIVFVTKPGTNTDWVERGVIETARTRYSVPVEHIALTSG
jgi:hypothetical protein